jgi:hypothetical protein
MVERAGEAVILHLAVVARDLGGIAGMEDP